MSSLFTSAYVEVLPRDYLDVRDGVGVDEAQVELVCPLELLFQNQQFLLFRVVEDISDDVFLIDLNVQLQT